MATTQPDYLNDDPEGTGQSYISADYAPPSGDPMQAALGLIGEAKRAGHDNVDDYLRRPDQVATQRSPQTVTMARLIQKNMNVPALRAAYSNNQR